MNSPSQIITDIERKKVSLSKPTLNQYQIAVFEIDNQKYAINIKDLREIIKIPDITPVPNAPNFVKGIFYLHGKIVMSVDLRKLFSLDNILKNNSEYIIITECGDSYFGIMVDNVTEISYVSNDNIKINPDFIPVNIKKKYLGGIITTDNSLIVLLNVKSIFSDNKLLTYI